MKNYGGIWRHFSDAEEPKYRPCTRGQFKSNLELKSYTELSPILRRRTPSLPPINAVNYETLQCSPPDEGDTSGYASDSAGNEYLLGETWTKHTPWTSYPRKTPESSGERAKWGDRGVGIGHLWTPNPHIPQAPLPLVERSTPSWLNRGLREPAQVLVIAHEETYTDSLTSSQDMSKSCDTIISTDDFPRNYLRGQIATSDPQVIADRERRRLKAIEQHNAIKQQVEEKEKKKREEMERLEREEREEEERLKRYQELELMRIEEEKRKLKEKAEKEEKKAKAMREALEIAERAAKEEKARARRKHLRKDKSPVQHIMKYSDKENEKSEQKELIKEESNKVHVEETEHVRNEHQNKEQVKDDDRKAEHIMDEHQVQDEMKDVKTEDIKTNEKKEEQIREEKDKELPRVMENEIIDSGVESCLTESKDESEKCTEPETKPEPSQAFEPSLERVIPEVCHSPPPPPEQSFEKMATHPSEIRELTLAVSELRIEAEEIDASRICVVPSPGRLLTPTVFRQKAKTERSTQTETKTRISRSKSIRMEDRPKWGVNRPTTRYVKASDRDPYRKTIKYRQNDSRSPSPMNHSKTSFMSFCPLSGNTSSGSSGNIYKPVNSKAVGTPRVVHVLPNTGVLKKSSAGKKYISIKNGRKVSSKQISSVVEKHHDLSDILTVKEVLAQLTALKKGLTMKKKEWAVTRSPTPFSEVSSVS
ncbi:trichohyalin-like [Cimex lectularius]|uniref:CCDC66 domain-containing protein n=1 Tax=Cimex lectularius TaxID=79782 RepID=A0A8I6RD18_CIMLE|nr:trichohyalin-like [Cimex lectularius]